MNLFYRALLRTTNGRLRPYVLVAALLLIIAAAPVLLPAIAEQRFSIAENSVENALVGGIEPTVDGNGNPLYFEIVAASNSNVFTIEAATGLIRLGAEAQLDYETQSTYGLKVHAVADKGLPTQSITEVDVIISLLDMPEAPSAVTEVATGLSENAATLEGKARANGAETQVAFQRGLSSGFGYVDPASLPGVVTLAAGDPEAAVELPLSNLEPATTYYYRLVAKNSENTSYGEVRSFTTYSIPAVASIKRETSTPTNADVLQFRVTFSEAVSGVDATDFSLIKSGTANGSIGTVAGQSAAVYLVTVNSVVGDGELRLDFIDNNSVLNAQNVATAAAFTTGEAYLIDNTMPTIAISAPSFPYTQIGPSHWDLTYSEPVNIILSASHVNLNTTGTATGIAEISGTGSTARRVTVRNISGNGTLSISVLAETATDAAGNKALAAGPSGTVVVDNIAPSSTCPAAIVVGTDASACSAYITVPLPTYDDNLDKGAVRVTNDRTGTPNASDTYPLGETRVTWRFEDPSGNYTTCSTLITVLDRTTPVVVSVPQDITVPAEAGSCGAPVNYQLPEIRDNCSGLLTPAINGPASGSVFPVGETRITYAATDAAGNTISGSFLIKVIDTQKPVIQCPTVLGVYEIKPGESGVVVDYDAVTAQDNCSGVTITRTAGFASGALVPAGTHMYKFEARDAAGNTAECSFTIQVVNNDPPVIGDNGGSLKDDWTYEDVAKSFSFKVSDGVTASDKIAVRVQAADAALFPAQNIKIEAAGDHRTFTLTPALNRDGASKITLQISDAAGNTTQKEFLLTVVAVADKPLISLAANTITGKEEAAIPLGISVALADLDGSESLEDVLIEGVPANATLSAGTKLQTGAWQLQAEEVPGLSLRSADCHEPFTLSVKAASKEASNGNRAESQQNLGVAITCVNDAPAFTLDRYVVQEKEDFSETGGDVTIKITLQDPDTDHAQIEFLPVSPSVDWVKVAVNAAEKTIVLSSVKDKNHPEPFTFTIRADDKEAENNIYEQTFTVQIDTLNDAPYGDLDKLSFEVGLEGVHAVVPGTYHDVDFGDRPSNERLTITLENAPAWLQVRETTAQGGLQISLAGIAPKEDEGKVYEEVKAVVTDVWGVQHVDVFDVYVVCSNALPVASEEEITIALLMNKASEEAYAFSVLDDAKAVDAAGNWLNIQVVEVDETMLKPASIEIAPSETEENVWLISKGLEAQQNQYGETEFRIRINDYVYCESDKLALDENGERKPVYITVKVVISLEDVLDIPTLITPNGDGANDSWNILGLEEFQRHEVKIFDARGRMIFFSSNYGAGAEWDGRLNGFPLPDGAYVYQIIFNNGADKREGRITLAR